MALEAEKKKTSHGFCKSVFFVWVLLLLYINLSIYLSVYIFICMCILDYVI